jgi:hypothetical protein
MFNYSLSVFQTLNISLFGFFFGGFESITNIFYLITKNYDLPRKQHGKELPTNATDSQVFNKVKRMFLLGLILIVISLISVIIAPQFFILGGAAIFLNGLIDYSYYKKEKLLFGWIIIAIFSSLCSLL